MSKKLQAEHGIVCRLTGRRDGYFGWPSVARMDDGTLVAASSGLRTRHVCPFGKTVLNFSRDEGRTWSAPRVINDSPLDDRDAGVVNLGGRRMLVTWFTSDTRHYFERLRPQLSDDELARWEQVLGTWTDELVDKWLGSWVMRSEDGESWSEPIRCPVSTPHGPIVLAGGGLLYLGKRRSLTMDLRAHPVAACRSDDGGRTWQVLSDLPVAPGTRVNNFHEPHVVELEDGRLLGMIRFQFDGEDDPARADKSLVHFSLYQTASDDGGRTWSTPRATGVYGSPPHLLRHSSGAIVCVYGYRQAPFGQRVMISRDGGGSWQADLILRDDGPGGDLGYPASVEMPDGSIFTVYYQKHQAGELCSLLWSRWQLS